MTDQEAARELDGLSRMFVTDDFRAACRRGAAALRQPRLPNMWPLKWENTNPKGIGAYVAPLPLTTYAATVYRIHPGCWRWHLPSGKEGFCTTAWSARRAAERAVSRAVAESLKGGRK